MCRQSMVIQLFRKWLVLRSYCFMVSQTATEILLAGSGAIKQSYLSLDALDVLILYALFISLFESIILNVIFTDYATCYQP